MFSAKGNKKYAGFIFLFLKFELNWAAFIFVNIHRQIEIWIEQLFSKSADGSAWEHLINQNP